MDVRDLLTTEDVRINASDFRAITDRYFFARSSGLTSQQAAEPQEASQAQDQEIIQSTEQTETTEDATHEPAQAAPQALVPLGDDDQFSDGSSVLDAVGDALRLQFS